MPPFHPLSMAKEWTKRAKASGSIFESSSPSSQQPIAAKPWALLFCLCYANYALALGRQATGTSTTIIIIIQRRSEAYLRRGITHTHTPRRRQHTSRQWNCSMLHWSPNLSNRLVEESLLLLLLQTACLAQRQMRKNKKKEWKNKPKWKRKRETNRLTKRKANYPLQAVCLDGWWQSWKMARRSITERGHISKAAFVRTLIKEPFCGPAVCECK